MNAIGIIGDSSGNAAIGVFDPSSSEPASEVDIIYIGDHHYLNFAEDDGWDTETNGYEEILELINQGGGAGLISAVDCNGDGRE